MDIDQIVKDAALQIQEITYHLQKASCNLHIVGGFLYRNIIIQLYGVDTISNYDIDFIADEVDLEALPKAWKVKDGGFPQLSDKCKGWRITAGVDEFDISLFRDHATSVLTGAEPGIRAYLKYVPLSLQSIAYDVRKGRLIGTTGPSSIYSGIVWFNNPEVLRTGRDYWLHEIYQKAHEFGFAVDLSNLQDFS